MGSALLNPPTTDPAPFETNSRSHAHEALRLQVAERLAAHRNRRPKPHNQPSIETAPASPAVTRSTRIAASVAERFAHTQSYSAFLAAEAERATRQAQAAAEIAARNAEAVAQAEQQLLRDLYAETRNQQALEEAARQPRPLELWPEAGLGHTLEPDSPIDARQAPIPRAPRSKPANREAQAASPAELAASPSTPVLTVRPFGSSNLLAVPNIQLAARPQASSNTSLPSTARRQTHEEEAEASALDAEITFRHAPVFEEPAGPPMPLPANLIEFPRQLVAPRKARPRCAEGPLRDEEDTSPSDSQLRIFEVDAAQISTTPSVVEDPTHQWTSIWLDPAPRTTAPESADHAPDASTLASPYAAVSAYPNDAPDRYPAAISRRVLAASIDAGLILVGFVASAATFAAVALHSAPPGTGLQDLLGVTAIEPANLALVPALAVTAVALVFLYFAYQLLFFSLTEATPGMRCARIALCTFNDENPTRQAMRRRIFAVLISACPFGLGLLWATLDDDRLTWHDLISRMYQRSY